MFSLWLDFIERKFLESGDFAKLVERNIIDGATSNPAIFQQAFTKSDSYLQQIRELKSRNFSAEQIYEELAITDIHTTAKQLLPLYEQGKRGFVSIEVNPLFADDATNTIEEGKRIFEKISYPNVMIKIPATEAGYIAMEKLASLGIPINATLIFSLEEAIKSAEAIQKGDGKGVLSIFVSRLDRATSSKHFGIANSSKIYREITKRNYSNITPLFASTGVKDPSLPADYYIRELLTPNSINTAPLQTIEAYIQSGGGGDVRFPLSPEQEQKIFEEIEKNYSIEEVLSKLKIEGIEAFKNSYRDIISYLDEVE